MVQINTKSISLTRMYMTPISKAAGGGGGGGGTLKGEKFSAEEHKFLPIRAAPFKMMMIWYFTSLSTLFKSCQDDERVIMKGYVQ